MMKKTKYVVSTLLSLCLILMCISISGKANTVLGSGTEQDPYLIPDEEALLQIKEVRDAHYKLTANIEVGSWTG